MRELTLPQILQVSVGLGAAGAVGSNTSYRADCGDVLVET